MSKTRFTELFPEDLTYERKSRIQKAKKIISILKDSRGDLSQLSCLDLGCSVGIITEFLGRHFKEVVGVDVDKEAIKRAKKRAARKNVSFLISEENALPVKDESFDVVIFNQVYEHAENPERLISEIKRVLKPGGVCYFGARNKYSVFDGHYPLPLLSWFPRGLSNACLKAFTGRKEYDIRLYPLWKLDRLVSDFVKKDYTLEVIKNPQKFHAKDVVPVKLRINRIIFLLARLLYIFIPNYIWVLEKKK